MKKKAKRSPNSQPLKIGIRWGRARREAARKALLKAATLIEKTGELAYGEFAYGIDDEENVSPTSRKATCWCSIGALCKVTRSYAPGQNDKEGNYVEDRDVDPRVWDAAFALGKTFDPEVASRDDAILAVYDLNDANDLGRSERRVLIRVSPDKHVKNVVATFRRAAEALS